MPARAAGAAAPASRQVNKPAVFTPAALSTPLENAQFSGVFQIFARNRINILQMFLCLNDYVKTLGKHWQATIRSPAGHER
jgi:hypothetical protein